MPSQPGWGIKTPQRNTQGGFWTASIYSGQANMSGQLQGCPLGSIANGADVLLYPGAGRLDLVFVHQPSQSGLAIVFYDAGIATSGGPFPLSGTKIVGVYPPTWRVPVGVSVASGQTNFVDSQPGAPFLISVPFQSGLCVACKSGQPGFTVNFTPELAGH